ncbi:MAG: hypothetical protein ABW352_19190 [Polyangiales bacterium]
MLRVHRLAPCLIALATAGCSLIGYDETPELDAGAPDAATPDAAEPVLDARVEDAEEREDAQADARSVEDAALADADLEETQDAASDAQAEQDAASDAGDAEVDAGLDSGVDAGDAGVDAGVDAATDAAVDGSLPPSTAVDAGPDNSEAGVPWDAGTATCAGTRALNLCWYLAPTSTSCNTFCASHGGFDTRALATVGGRMQGGSRANCRVVLNALGLSGDVTAGTRSDGRGFGCHQWQNPIASWWLANPGFSANASAAIVRPACACSR